MNKLISNTDKRSFQRRSLPRRPPRSSHKKCKACTLRLESMREMIDELRQQMNEIHNSLFLRDVKTFPPDRRFWLKFIRNPKDTTFTKDELKTDCGENIQVALFNANNEHVTEDQVSNCQLEVVLLKGDFDASDEHNWTPEHFENQIEKGRNGKELLLDGQLNVRLTGGIGTLGSIRIMDNSSWTRSRTFRLGVRVSRENLFLAKEIREGKSQPFIVKEKRGKGHKKHEKPSLEDEVWRLERISRSGKYLLKFNEFGIHKIKDFLVCNRIKPDMLKEVMLPKHYRAAVQHAQSCILGTLFLYKNKGFYLVLNKNHELLGIFQSDMYTSVEKIGNSVKKSLVKTASYINTYVEPLCIVENQTVKGGQLYGESLLQNDTMGDIQVLGECSHQNSAYTTIVATYTHQSSAHTAPTTVGDDCNHQKTEECSQQMTCGANSKMLSNPVQHYVVEKPYIDQGASLVEGCNVFSPNEICYVIVESSHSDHHAAQCTTEQENRPAQQDVVSSQNVDFPDMKCNAVDEGFGEIFWDSSLNLEADGFVGDPIKIHIENNTQGSSGFPDLKCNAVNSEFGEIFWDSCLNPEADDVNMDWFVGDPIKTRTNGVWLRVRTFMRCAFLIRSVGHP